MIQKIKNKLTENKTFAKFIKFTIIGIIATLIDYSVMIILKEIFSFSVLIASGIAFTVALIFNFTCNMMFVFVDKKEGMTKTKAAIIFLITSVIGLGLNQLIMYLLTEKILIHYIIAKLFSIMVVGLWNFFSKKIMIEK